MKTILFVCSGNTCRSPMAEGIFNCLAKESGLDYIAKSAGTHTESGLSATKNAILAADEIGADISSHKSNRAEKELVDNAELILTMTHGHKLILDNMYPDSKEKIHSLCDYVNHSGTDGICDPYGGDIEEYRSCRNIIKILIENLISALQKSG